MLTGGIHVKAKPSYRADIEGLRALAVILVILYHYQVPGISGGFIGVDVFFVISGFVITQLLERAFQKDTFRFRDFYARRIRRLVPVFLLVSTATFLMISPFYIGDAYYIFAKSWLASLIGLSNLYYFNELSQYFAPETLSLSLLHTWSLAVEEQFYLLWPASLYLAYRFGKGRTAHWPFRITLVATFVLSVYMASALLITKHDHFPGYNALWPTLGTAMVIYAGLHQPATFTARLLSLPVMVFLGGISYSLYLWHWPPVALMHYQLIELTWLNRLLLIAGVVALSWFSFRFVENRYRHRDWSFTKSFLIFILAPLIVIWAIQSTIRIADDTSFRIPEERRELYKIIANNNPADLYKRCFKGKPVEFNQSDACLFGAKPADGQPNSMLIGDSHAIAQIGFIEQLLKGTDYSVLMVTRASTPFLPPAIAEKAQASDPTKVARNQALSDYLSQRPMTVFIGAWWSAYLKSEHYQRYFVDTIGWLKAHGHTVIVMEDVPELPSSSYAECLLKNMDDCSISAEDVKKSLANFYRFKQNAQQRYPDVQWINPRKVLCDATRCQTVLNGIPLYRDESHLNNVGGIEIGQEYLKRFGNPLTSSEK
ncbi:MAG: acyltransferase [Alcanivorax borkumensis]|uniref:Acyltransferase, putative n=1 Tax=Alcanivorax borkumensis (strain ATCC 700651 / DSM 11573 / NCIMB 13689 / SK2) TaxID=393595 RepID=Q0VRS3_ALCBS|nr:MAG: acyltransferase [Alcanivorax borkumensis]CAL16125.1 acyltransferase, putative [Alcanivorax borkumensis SK2]